MARAPRAAGGLARLMVLGGAMLWGTTGTTQALGPAGATSATVGAMRLVTGALALLVLSVLVGRHRMMGRLLRADLRVATLVAMAAIAAYQVSFFAGVGRTGVAVGTVVGIGSAPVFTGVIELVVRGVRPERVWAASTGLAVVGCALLVGSGGDAQVDPLGVVLALGAGASYAVYTVASKQLLDAGTGPFETMAATFAGGTVVLLPVLVVGDLGWVAQPRGIAVVLWLGVGTVALGYVLFARGLQALPAATVATLTLAEPLTAAVLGVAVLGERPGLVAVAGAGLVAAGLVLLAVRPGTRARRAPTAASGDEPLR